MKYVICAGAAFAACALPANASPTIAQASVERTNYSGDFGNRLVGEFNLSHRWKDTTIVFDLARGTRDYADEDYSASRFGATVYHDWSERLYTETSVAVAGNSPVFARRRIKQDVNLKIGGGAVATLGVGHNRYFGGRDALTWSAGGSYYFGGGFATYRYTGYDVEQLGRTHGHLASVRLNDGRGEGFTQLWAGAGNSLHDFDFRPTVGKGDLRSVALRRVQPLVGKVALDVSIGRSWYDTGIDDYRGTTGRIGLTLLR